MKKSLLLLPLIAAGLTLAGCGERETGGAHVHTPGTKWYYNESSHWHKCVGEGCDAKNKHLDEAEHDFVEDMSQHVDPKVGEAGYAYYECSVCGYAFGEDLPELTDKRGPKTVGDYVRVDNPVAGEKYYFGFYNYSSGKLRLANGNYHSDSKGSYPFYMATEETDAETDEAAQFEISYLNDDEFSIYVTCPSYTSRPWHNKYMSIYSANSSYENFVMSLAPVDDINEQYQPLSTALKPNGSPVDVMGKFKFYGETENAGYSSIGIVAQHKDEDNERLWLFGCTYDKYVSVDCTNEDKALSDEYSVAHFYKLAD